MLMWKKSYNVAFSLQHWGHSVSDLLAFQSSNWNCADRTWVHLVHFSVRFLPKQCGSRASADLLSPSLTGRNSIRGGKRRGSLCMRTSQPQERLPFLPGMFVAIFSVTRSLTNALQDVESSEFPESWEMVTLLEHVDTDSTATQALC